MKRTFLLILPSLLGLIFLLGCGDENTGPKTETEVTAEDVKKEANEAVEKAVAYTQQQKDEYMRSIEAKLEELDQEIEALETKAQSQAAELTEESKAEFNQRMDALRSKKQAAAEKLDEIKTSSGQAWDDLKSGMDAAIDELGKAFDQAKSNFEG